MEAVQADLRGLPFRPGSFDHVILFQTLEHMTDPIRILQDISRVGKTSLTLSVPTVSRTNVHGRGYIADRRDYEQHVFEFSDRDLGRVITHTDYRLVRMDHAVLLDGSRGGLSEVLAMWIHDRVMANPARNPEYHAVAGDLFWGTFKRFTLLHLRKDGGSPHQPEKT
jgi:SAM-dependent methyltransferase